MYTSVRAHTHTNIHTNTDVRVLQWGEVLHSLVSIIPFTGDFI